MILDADEIVSETLV